MLAFSQIKLFAQKIQVFLFLLIILETAVSRIIFGCTSSPCPEDKTCCSIDVKKFLSALSLQERFLLEFFFRSLIQEDAIGYVLLEGKPMGLYSYIKPKITINSLRIQYLDRKDLFFEGFNERDALFHKGLEIWKKYEHHFCGNNIFFDVFEQDQELCFMQLSVFNKNLMFPLFDRYFHEFIHLDHSIKDKESLFSLLLNDQKFKEKFYGKECLLGICLGYGEKNAELFQKMVRILTSMGRLDFTLEQPSPERLRSLEQELATLERSFTGGMHIPISRKLFFNIGLGFRANFSDPETLILQKKYSALHKKLTQAYEGGSYLEKTLELICAADKAGS